MLYRAFVYPPVTFSTDACLEVCVFFEASSTESCYPRLRHAVGAAWNMPADCVDHYNCFSELELRNNWDAAPAQQRDMVLLQTGDGPSGPSYADPARTQFLVGPRWHARLLAAQRGVLQHQAQALGAALNAYRSNHPAPATPAAATPAQPRQHTGLDDLLCPRTQRNIALGV